MATIEQEGVLSFVNEEGNIVEMYPEIKTNDTLITSGKAADAKAVGDKIAEIEDVIDNEVADLETKINSLDDSKTDIIGSGLGTALSMSTNDSWNDITGAISGVTNNGAYTSSISTSGGSIIIPKGYHNGSGKVTGPTLSSLIDTNVTLASSSKLLSGYTAYGKNGVKYTGTNLGYNAGYEDGLAASTDPELTIINGKFNSWGGSPFGMKDFHTSVQGDIALFLFDVDCTKSEYAVYKANGIYINTSLFTINWSYIRYRNGDMSYSGILTNVFSFNNDTYMKVIINDDANVYSGTVTHTHLEHVINKAFDGEGVTYVVGYY